MEAPLAVLTERQRHHRQHHPRHSSRKHQSNRRTMCVPTSPPPLLPIKPHHHSFRGVATWPAVENSVAVINACLPTTRPLIVTVSPHFFSHHSSHGNTAQGSRSHTFQDTLARPHPRTDYGDSKSYNRLHEGYVPEDQAVKLDSYPGAHHHQTYVGKEDLSELEGWICFMGVVFG